MYKIEEYKIATYAKALYGKSATKYVVPEKIVKYQFNKIKDRYEPIATFRGRQRCGELIHKVRTRLKDYMKSLHTHKDELYHTELSKHKNKEGFWDPSNVNYNADRMVNDDKFMPNGKEWFKRNWGNGVWSKGSPVPSYKEPYWHSEHSIKKSNDWIVEHLDHMQHRIEKDLLNREEYGVLLDHLENCLIELRWGQSEDTKSS